MIRSRKTKGRWVVDIVALGEAHNESKRQSRLKIFDRQTSSREIAQY